MSFFIPVLNLQTTYRIVGLSIFGVDPNASEPGTTYISEGFFAYAFYFGPVIIATTPYGDTAPLTDDNGNYIGGLYYFVNDFASDYNATTPPHLSQ